MAFVDEVQYNLTFIGQQFIIITYENKSNNTKREY